MMDNAPMPEHAVTVGVYGKHPAFGDFVSSGLSASLTGLLEQWFAHVMPSLREGWGDAWEHNFDSAFPLRFWFGPDLTPEGRGLLGVVRSSHDRVGRRFPLLAAIEGSATESPVKDQAQDIYAALEASLDSYARADQSDAKAFALHVASALPGLSESLPLQPATTAQRWAACASVCAAVAYAALAGFSLPTQRAVFMLAMFMLARSNGFRLPLAGVLCAAALLIAMSAPLSVRSSGFWLSFIAVGALLFVHAHRVGAARNRLWVAARVQIACTMALTPMLLLFFQSSSLLMPAVNLLVVPLVAVCIVPATLGLLAIAALGVSAPELFLGLLDWLINFTWDVLGYFASSVKNNSSLVYSPGALGFLGLALASGLLLAPPALRRHTLFVLPLCYLPAVSTVVSTAEQTNGCDKAEFAVLDVGQGLSAVFSAYGRTMVYDVGARYSDSFDVGSAVVAPYLRSKGRYEVDVLVLSHEDNDHAGGLRGLQRLIPVKTIVASFEMTQAYSGSSAPLTNTSAHALAEPKFCKAGESWHWDDISFEFLAPTAEGLRHFSKSNNRSCVLKISAPGFSVLLPGDIEADAEKSLIDRASEGRQLATDIVVMPHHGSKSSSGDAFVTATSAQFAIASAAYKGRFGHPHSEVLERYVEAGTRVLQTAQMGAIEFDLSICSTTVRLEPKGFRQHWGNYWLGW